MGGECPQTNVLVRLQSHLKKGLSLALRVQIPFLLTINFDLDYGFQTVFPADD